MSTKDTLIPVSELGKYIARGVLRAPDIDPRKKGVSTHEILATVRPSWSKLGRYELALPGGKLEHADFKSSPEISKDALNDPAFLITVDQLIQAGVQAVMREIYEELNLSLLSSMLTHVEEETGQIPETNEHGYATLVYAATLPKKPLVIVRPESAGTVWIDQKAIEGETVEMLSGHVVAAKRALKKLQRSE